MANYRTRIDLSRQAEVNELTYAELSDNIEEGKTILYKREDGELGIASKYEGFVITGYTGGNIVRGLPIPQFPDAFPGESKAHVLSMVAYGDTPVIKWVLVNTDGDFNEV
jgi:hypothetical protein